MFGECVRAGEVRGGDATCTRSNPRRFALQASSAADKQEILCSGTSRVPSVRTRETNEPLMHTLMTQGAERKKHWLVVAADRHNRGVPNDRQISDRCFARLGVCPDGLRPARKHVLSC